MIRLSSTVGDVTVTRYIVKNPIVEEMWETKGQKIYDEKIIRHDEYVTEFGAIIKVKDIVLALSREEFSCLQQASVELSEQLLDRAIDWRLEELNRLEENHESP
jgi:hypothetical protein